jgi:hypothetical protein
MSLNSFAGLNFNDPQLQNIIDYREKNMCPEWKQVNRYLPTCDVNIMSKDSSFLLNGTLKGDLLKLSQANSVYVKYWAANIPNYNSNFSGSGLPFPTEEIAFENTVNLGKVQVLRGNFSFSMRYPNSYYINMGATYVPPEVQIQVCDENNNNVSDVQHINLGQGIPFRTLTWPNQRNWNNGAMFYNVPNLPVRNQEQILKDSAYPKVNVMPKNFWGTKPPM